MRGLGGYFCPPASPSILALVSDNQAVGISLYQPSNISSGRINSPESPYTGLSFCLNTKGRVGNVSPSRGIYGSLLTHYRSLIRMACNTLFVAIPFRAISLSNARFLSAPIEIKYSARSLGLRPTRSLSNSLMLLCSTLSICL